MLVLRGVLIWLGAVGIAAGFYWLDTHYGCAFFQRGGAALVIYTVMVGVYSLKERADYADELHAIQREQCQIAQAMYAEEHEARGEAQIRLRRQIEPRLKELDGKLASMVEAGGRFQALRMVEGPILLAGTLIWGFGDLLVRSPGCAV